MGTQAIESRLGLLATVVFFLVPVQLLNFSALWAGYRKKDWLATMLARWGLVALMGSVLVSPARYAFYIDKVILYPPAFALLFIRSAAFYLFTQMLGIVLLVAGFLLMHRNVVRGKMPVAPEIPNVQ